MKTLPLLILIIVVIVLFWFFKTDYNDSKARKDAIKVEATVEKLRCKQRLKSDQSLIVVNYKGKSYSLLTPESKCNSFELNKSINVFYSFKYDKLFLEK